MKISEMTNDQAAEAMIRLSVPMSNICDSEEIAEMLTQLSGMAKMPLIRTIGKMLPKFVLYGLKDHKQDVYEIIGALQMVPTEKVGKLNFKETVAMLRDSYDEIIASFFT